MEWKVEEIKLGGARYWHVLCEGKPMCMCTEKERAEQICREHKQNQELVEALTDMHDMFCRHDKYIGTGLRNKVMAALAQEGEYRDQFKRCGNCDGYIGASEEELGDSGHACDCYMGEPAQEGEG